jgi:hypothetical protein
MKLALGFVYIFVSIEVSSRGAFSMFIFNETQYLLAQL